MPNRRSAAVKLPTPPITDRWQPHCKKSQNFHGNFPITLRAEFRNSKGRYIPSPNGIIPLLLRDQVKVFLNNATKVKIRKKYIVGLIFEIPLIKGKLPVTYRENSGRDQSLIYKVTSLQTLT